MVFVLQSEKSEIYSAIQKKAAASVCSVLIFVAPTVDALCALKILVVRKCEEIVIQNLLSLLFPFLFDFLFSTCFEPISFPSKSFPFPGFKT